MGGERSTKYCRSGYLQGNSGKAFRKSSPFKMKQLLAKHYSWCVTGHVSEAKHGALGSKSFAIAGASTAKLNLFPRSSPKVRVEMGYEITGPFPWYAGSESIRMHLTVAAAS